MPKNYRLILPKSEDEQCDTSKSESVHAKSKPHKCGICEKCFTKPSDLQRHIQAVHEKSKPHKCDICQKSFALKSTLKTHFKFKHFQKDANVDEHECVICEFKFNSKHSLKKHVQSVHEQSKPHKCDHCQQGFFLNSTLKRHIESTHPSKVLMVDESKPSKCSDSDEGKSLISSECDHKVKEEPRSEKIKKELGSKQGKLRAYKCNICERFFDKRDLQTHFRSAHEQTKPPKNDICEMDFANTSDLKRSSGKYACPHRDCGKFFSKPSHRETHLLSHIGEKAFKCSIVGCKKSYSRRAHLKRHEQNEHKLVTIVQRLPCELCKKTFADIHSLKKHTKKAHESDHKVREEPGSEKIIEEPGSEQDKLRAYKCNICEHFIDKRDLQTHFRLVHEQTKPPINDICEKDLANTSDLKKRSGKYACPHRDCGKVFSRPSRLETHLLSHSGEKPFECSIVGCKKSYSRRAHLKRHERIDHMKKPVTIMQKLSCELCNKTYANIYSLKKHTKIAHESQEHYNIFHMKKLVTIVQRLSCELCKKTFADIHSLEKHTKQAHESDHEAREEPGSEKIIIEPGSEQDKSRAYKCNVCEHFIDKRDLQTHFRLVHELSKPPMCDICDEDFAETSDLKRHIQAVHEKVKLADEVEITLKSEIDDATTYCKESKPSTCDICKDPLMLRSDFEAHQAKEHGIHKCYECNITFHGSKHLNQHNLSVHKEIRQDVHGASLVYECHECNVTFPGSELMNEHYESVHLAKNPNRCSSSDAKESEGSKTNAVAEHDDIEIKDEPLDCS